MVKLYNSVCYRYICASIDCAHANYRTYLPREVHSFIVAIVFKLSSYLRVHICTKTIECQVDVLRAHICSGGHFIAQPTSCIRFLIRQYLGNPFSINELLCSFPKCKYTKLNIFIAIFCKLPI